MNTNESDLSVFMNTNEALIYHWYPSVPSGECIELTREGKPFEQIYCVYPWLKNFYMRWEIAWHPFYLYDFVLYTPWFPVACCAIYLLAIFGGQKYMESRNPYVCRKSLAAWNLFLSIFSWMGVARVLPSLIHNVSFYGLEAFFCIDPEQTVGESITGLWLVFFVLSKPAELFDTFFIVAGKRKLILLHWYHHLSVLLCTWFTFVARCPPGLFYITINYAVHAVMYLYYFLMTIRCKPKWFHAKWITIAQISQMVLGSIISVAAFHAASSPGCWATWENNTGILIMYVSYLLLFVRFFLQRYVIGVKMEGKTTKAE